MAVANCLGHESQLDRTLNLYVTRSIVAAVDVPVMADGEDGYGGPVETAETIAAFVDAGVAGINLEDQHTAEQGYPGNREDFARTLEYLRNLRVDIWLGAHPNQSDAFVKHERLASGETPSPFIDPNGWQRFIEEIQAQFDAMCGAPAHSRAEGE